MPHTQFDPFGETITPRANDGTADVGPASGVSRIALRLGVGLFWTLVAGIVAARVAFFDPASLEFGSVIAFLGRVRALVFA